MLVLALALSCLRSCWVVSVIDKVGLAFVLLFAFVLVLDLFFDSMIYTLNVYPSLQKTHIYYPNGSIQVVNESISEIYVYQLHRNGTLIRRG